MMIQLIHAGILFHTFNILILLNVILYKYILIYINKQMYRIYLLYIIIPYENLKVL